MSNFDPDNPQAFPLPSMRLTDGRGYPSQPGMTLRDWFAGQAIMGIGQAPMPPHADGAPETFARLCYAVADAMLAERGK